ncbi:MAG: flagellar export chaperone FlgN [Vampirovibrionales bacterium]|nr:flagellar export chaperone FlgN [Vampirovibrionales bacterium]
MLHQVNSQQQQSTVLQAHHASAEALLLLLQAHSQILSEMLRITALKHEALLKTQAEALLSCDQALAMLAEQHSRLMNERIQVLAQMGLSADADMHELLALILDEALKQKLLAAKQAIFLQARELSRRQQHQAQLMQLSRQWVNKALGFYTELVNQLCDASEPVYGKPGLKPQLPMAKLNTTEAIL